MKPFMADCVDSGAYENIFRCHINAAFRRFSERRIYAAAGGCSWP